MHRISIPFLVGLPAFGLLACADMVFQPEVDSNTVIEVSSSTMTPPVQVSNLSVATNRTYRVEHGGLAVNARRFIDAGTTFAAPIPTELVGATFIRTAEADLNAAIGSTDFLSFDIDADAVLYVAHERRLALPAWLSSSFTDSGLELRDSGKNRFRLFSRDVGKGRVTLGSNLQKAVKNGTMYSVIVVANPAAAENPAPPPEEPPPPPTDPPPPPADSFALVVNECAAPRNAWIWCDDFEQDRLSKYFEYDASGGKFARVTGVGGKSSTGMRARWASAGQVAAGSLKLAFGATPSTYFRAVDEGKQKHREIYWRVYLRNQTGWVGGGADKLSRATVFAGANWSQAMIAHVWSGASSTGNSFLVADPASGTDVVGTLKTTKYNDFDNLRWLGSKRGSAPLFSEPEIGKWHCVEAYVRLNDSGLSNGVFRTWVNGTVDAERTGLNWLGGYSDYGINAVFLENYWNNGSPQPQERYFDNFVVSTERIGC